MEYTRISIHSKLTFSFQFKLDNAEYRPKWYGQGSYQPTSLTFTLEARDPGGELPNPADLIAVGISLDGYTIKKDGTPGQASTSEQFFSTRNYPSWLAGIIEEAKQAAGGRQ
jgi:hypothetical protein